MAKLTIHDIENALNEAKIPAEQQHKVIEHLQKIAKTEDEAPKEISAGPKLKNEFGILIFDEKNELAGKELYGHIYSVKEGFDHGTILGRVSNAVKESNELAKNKNSLIKTIGEAFSHLKRKFSKAQDFQPKTKEIVRVTITNNKLV
jgi:hypothetical protein